MCLVFDPAQSYADTIEVGPYSIYNADGRLFETLQEYIAMWDQLENEDYDQCMEEAEGQMYWYCSKNLVRDVIPHPLSDGYTNGLPNEYGLLLDVYINYSNVEGHGIIDEPADEGGLRVKVGWICPDDYLSSTMGPDSNRTLICYKNEAKSCPAGNPIDIVSGTKYEVETDYRSPNGPLKVERSYVSQKSGWLMSAEPRIQFLPPGEHGSIEGPFHGVRQGSCTDYFKLNVIKSQGGEWGYREVLRCARSINSDPASNIIYLWLKGNRYRMERYGDVYLWEGGQDKGLLIESVTAASIAGAAWRLRQADGSLSYFDTNGLILASLFADGSRVDYQYDQDRLISKLDQRGRTLNYQYDAGGRLNTVILPSGELIRYIYQGETPELNEFWLLSRVEWPNGESVTYRYNEAGNIESEPERFLTGKFDAYGNRIGTYKYGVLGQAYSTEGNEGERKRTIEYRRGRYHITDSNGAVEQLYFRGALSNGKPLLTKRVQPAASGGSAGRLYIYYNEDGKPWEVVDYDGSTTQHAYDPEHKLRTVSVTGLTRRPGTDLTGDGATLPTGARKQTTQWDNDLRKPLKIAEPKLITTYVYNGNPDPFNDSIPANCSSAQLDGVPLPVVCRVVRQATTDEDGSQGLNASLDPQLQVRHRLYTYNEEGQLLTTASSPDYLVETTYTYYPQVGAAHKKGDLRSITNILGHRVEYLAYDAHGNPTQIRDANGVLNEMSYDHRNRLTSYTTAGLTTILGYDLNGKLTTVTTPDGKALNREYDGAGRLSALVDAQLNRMEYGYDLEGNRLTEILYDASGATLFSKAYRYDVLNRVAKRIDASAEETTYGYDAEGKLTRTTDANLNSSVQAYDALDRLQQTTDALNGVTQYGYDAQGNLTGVTDPSGLITRYSYDYLGNLISQTSPDTGLTTYTYDEAGNRLSQTDARGITVSYSYDALNRLTHVSYPDASLNVIFIYDQGAYGIGRLTAITDGNGATEYAYNAYGDLISQTRTSSDGIVTRFSYDYDTQGRLASLAYPSGNSIHYSYDANGQLTGLSLEQNGAIRPLVSNLQKMPFGPVTSFDYGNGLSLTRSFDQDYRLIGQTIPGILQSSYQHDPVGNITDWEDLLSTGQDQFFGYDALYRLTSASGIYGDITYSYDATGNRRSLIWDGDAEIYSYGPGSHRLQQILGSVTDYRTYDAAGNTLQSLIGSYSYDETNRLIGFTKPGAAVRYAYNGKGERIQKNVDGVITRFRYAPSGELLGEYDQSGRAIREYITVEGQPVALVSTANSIYYLHTDHLGAVVKATDENQSIIWEVSRRPFGERTITTAQIEMPLGFPGQYFDEESNNYYNYFRDYDPATGRYLQSDPIGLLGGPNTYAYVGGNPTNYTDKYGLFCIPCAVVVVAGGAAISWWWQNSGGPDAMYNDWDTGSAVGPAPHTHEEEREARNFVPDPFGDNCPQLKHAIEVLEDQIKWRRTDLNPASTSYRSHKAHIDMLDRKREDLQNTYDRLCKDKC